MTKISPQSDRHEPFVKRAQSVLREFVGRALIVVLVTITVAWAVVAALAHP